MRIGVVIGRVTMNHQVDSYRGGRFLLVQPASRAQILTRKALPMSKANSAVVYDNLGAAPGDFIAYSGGGEAAMAFDEPTPVDAYNCMILDRISYSPPQPASAT